MTALGSFFAPEILPECVSFHSRMAHKKKHQRLKTIVQSKYINSKVYNGFNHHMRIANFVSLTACTVCVFKPTQTLILKSEPQAKKTKNYTNCNWELDKTGMQVKIISEVL